jgi:allantoinase
MPPRVDTDASFFDPAAGPMPAFQETSLHPRERLAFSSIEHRVPLKFPDGIRLVVWPLLALEEWDLARPMARMVISPPQGQPQLPDLPNWSWHEYGMRVGFWRLRRMLLRLGISPTVTLNARVCETYPQVVEACMQSGWELNAHGYDQVPMHKLDDQRAVIAKSMDIIERFSGRRPRGWFGPGLTQTFETLDYLSEAGVEYIGDWVLDDEPVTLKTTHRPVVALPYNFEIHDIVMMALQHHPSDMVYRRAMDQFKWLYEESAERAKIMAIACHPYLSGVPHRIGYVQHAFEEILGYDGVVAWDGASILDWYLAQSRPA